MGVGTRKFATMAAGLLLLLSDRPAAARSLGTFESASGVTWDRQSFIDPTGAEQAYYLSAGAPEAPLILLIQGSGCVPLFATIGDRPHVATASQDVLVRAAGDHARVMVVEKPGVAFDGDIGPSPGLSEGCGLAFRSRYALDDWAGVLDRALDEAAASSSRVRPVALLGVSEGGTAAARLSQWGFDGPVGIVSGGSCFATGSLIDLAFNREREGRPGTSVDQTLRLLDEIRAAPEAVDRFAWGQTFQRWSTFGSACNTRTLEHHPGSLFIAYGTADPGIDIAAFENLAQVRETAGLRVLVHRVRGGDHDLSVGDADHRMDTFQAFLRFALSGA